MSIDINANVNKLNRDIQAQINQQPEEIEIDVNINQLTQNIKTQINVLDQDIEVDLKSSIIYAFSPVAKIQLLNNGYYKITITDKNGTTVGEIPTFSNDNIERIIAQYFQEHPATSQQVELHNQSNLAHQDIRNLIQNAINNIPIKISDLQNDVGYITNFKDMIIRYNTFYDFPNLPSAQERDMIFLDKSTGDMYLFGINDSLTYTSIGISSQDYIYGGDSST